MTGNNTADSWNAGLEAAKAYKRMYGVGPINLGGGPHGSKVRGDAETEAWEAFQPTLERRGLNERDMASARQNFMHAYYQEMNKGTYQERNPESDDSEPSADEIMTELKWGGKYSSAVVERVLKASRELEAHGDSMTFAVPGAPENLITIRKIGRSKFYVGETQSKKTALADGLDLLANELEYAYRTGRVAPTKEELYSSLRAAGVLPPARKFERGAPVVENPSTSDMEDLAFDAGKEWGLTGSWSSGVSNANVRRYGFVKWWNNTLTPATERQVRKRAVERAFYEGYKIGREKANQGFRESAKGRRNPSTGHRIAITYETITPESAEQGDVDDRGWIDQDGEDMDETAEDFYDGDVVKATIKGLQDNGVSEPSSSHFHPGVWYTAYEYNRDYRTGAVENRSFHLKGYTEDEERRVFEGLFGRKGQRNPSASGTKEFSFLVQPDGDLWILPSPAMLDYLKRAYAKEQEGGATGFHSDQFMRRHFGPSMKRAGFRWVRPEQIGALTDAPIIGKGVGVDRGLRVWWFPNYQVTSPQEVVARQGSVYFTAAPEPEGGSDRESNPYLLEGGYAVRRRYDDGSEDYYPRSGYLTREEAEKQIQKWEDSPYYAPRVSMSVVKFDDYELEGGKWKERQSNPTYEVYNYKTGEPAGRTFDTLQEAQEWIALRRAESPSIRLFWKVRKVGSTRNPESSDGTPDIYRTPVTIGGKRVTIFSPGVSSRQQANIINRLFPDHSGDKQWHARKAQEFVDLKNRAVDNHSSLWESSFRETFGRAPQPYDFRISGIGSDKLPAGVKDRLRELSRTAGAASEIAGAHAAAAGVKYHHGGHYLAHSSLGSKRNPEPAAADLYESFHGKPSEELLEIGEEVHYHENLAGLGTLTEIKVDCFSGYSAELKFDRDTQLCSNEEGTQLYIVGGDQSLDLKALKFKADEIDKDQVAVGVITEITYNTQKGFHNFKPTDYYHELGEESGYQPILTYDARSQLLTIAGGAYKIKPEGIVN